MVVRANAGQGVVLSASPGCAGSISYVACGTGYDQIASFTASGCLTVADGEVPVLLTDYMVVAGGGGGAAGYNGSGEAGVGGGGGGGFRESPGTSTGCYTVSPLGTSPATALSLVPGSYSITVGGGGAGGSGQPYPGGLGKRGSPSIFNPGGTDGFNTITATGGGGSEGYTGGGQPAPDTQIDGGSGGGTGYGSGGTGNQGGYDPPEGQPGASGSGEPASGGGGGGATAAGGVPKSPGGGDGGTGATTNITGSSSSYAGGGGGGGRSSPGGSGGTGGGGPGGSCSAGTAGTANTGGGGGGDGGPGTGGTGGSGIVVVRFPSSACISAAPGTNTVASCVGPTNAKVATFTVSGTLTVN